MVRMYWLWWGSVGSTNVLDDSSTDVLDDSSTDVLGGGGLG